MRDATVSITPCAKEYCLSAQGMVGGGAADHAGDTAFLTRLLISSRPQATGCVLHTDVPMRLLIRDDLVSSLAVDQIVAAGCVVPASLADEL